MSASESLDPQWRMREGLALQQAGMYREAMVHYAWCFDHGCQADESFSSVRASFLIGYMAKLGTHLPECVAFLDERRSSLETRFLRESLPCRDVQMLFALNRELKKPHLTPLVLVHKTVNNGWTEDDLQDALRLAASDIRFWPKSDFDSAWTLACLVSVLLVVRDGKAGIVRSVERNAPEAPTAVGPLEGEIVRILEGARESELIDLITNRSFRASGTDAGK